MMIVNIVQGIVISFILILIVHNLYIFFQNTLTIPKTKDLVNKPSKQYAEILNTIKSCNISNKMDRNDKNKNKNNNNDTTSIETLNNINDNNNKQDKHLNTEHISNMKTELRDFLTSLNANTLDNSKKNTGEYSSEIGNGFSAY